MEYTWLTVVAGTIAILVVAVLKLSAVMAKWKVLAAAFPADLSPRILAEFANAISTVGAVRFTRAGAGRLGITARGLLVAIGNPFMANLLIPFAAIKTVRTFTFLGRTTVALEVDHAVPLTLHLPVAALPHLSGRVSADTFQQEEAIASIGEVVDAAMREAQQNPSGDAVARVRRDEGSREDMK